MLLSFFINILKYEVIYMKVIFGIVTAYSYLHAGAASE